MYLARTRLRTRAHYTLHTHIKHAHSHISALYLSLRHAHPSYHACGVRNMQCVSSVSRSTYQTGKVSLCLCSLKNNYG